jgi:hypothetical protein
LPAVSPAKLSRLPLGKVSRPALAGTLSTTLAERARAWLAGILCPTRAEISRSAPAGSLSTALVFLFESASFRGLSRIPGGHLARLGPAWFPFTFGGEAQGGYFFRSKLAQLAGFEIEHQRAVADTANLFDEVPDALKHLAQLAIAAFREHHFIPGIVAMAHRTNLRRRRMHPIRAGALPFNGNAGAELVQLIFGRLASNLHQIGLFDARGRAGQLVRELAVVGHQKQALAVIVQAADGVEALLHL